MLCFPFYNLFCLYGMCCLQICHKIALVHEVSISNNMIYGIHQANIIEMYTGWIINKIRKDIILLIRVYMFNWRKINRSIIIFKIYDLEVSREEILEIIIYLSCT